MTQAAPLLELFVALCRRDFVLGPAEYVDALRALAAGFGEGSRQELVWLCQALWAKSPEEQQQVEAVMHALLPRRITVEEVDALARHIDEATVRGGVTAGPSPPGLVRQEVQVQESLSGATVRPIGFGTPTASPIGAIQRPRDELHEDDGEAFDLVGDLPVSRRDMKRAWCLVRRMLRVGPAVELDVTGTIDRLARDGVLAAPVLVAQRRNQAEVLLLIDEGGSMIPFRRTARALLDCARRAGFARFAASYFHDVPGDAVFAEPEMTSPRLLAEVVGPFAGGGVVILSDAGAARGRRDRARLEQTRRFLSVVRAVTPRLAWLNRHV